MSSKLIEAFIIENINYDGKVTIIVEDIECLGNFNGNC
jgi:hypothetical protein